MASVVVVVGMWGAGAAVHAELVTPSDPLGYAVFALEELRVGRRAQIGGAVGVNDGEAKLGTRTVVDGVVAADVIRVGRRVRTEGITCTLVVGGKDVCVPLLGPVVPQSALEVVQVDAGIGDVIVPRRARRVALAEGAYRRIRVGKGSTLTLSGGEYDVRSLTLARKATIVCDAPCRVRVSRKMVVGRGATVQGPDPLDPNLLRFDIEGRRSRTGLRIGSKATIGGILYGPTVDVRLGRRVRVTGSLVAGTLRAGSRLRADRP